MCHSASVYAAFSPGSCSFPSALVLGPSVRLLSANRGVLELSCSLRAVMPTAVPLLPRLVMHVSSGEKTMGMFRKSSNMGFVRLVTFVVVWEAILSSTGLEK